MCSVGSDYWLAEGESLISCGPVSELRRQDGSLLHRERQTDMHTHPDLLFSNHSVHLSGTLPFLLLRLYNYSYIVACVYLYPNFRTQAFLHIQYFTIWCVFIADLCFNRVCFLLLPFHLLSTGC